MTFGIVTPIATIWDKSRVSAPNIYVKTSTELFRCSKLKVNAAVGSILDLCKDVAII